MLVWDTGSEPHPRINDSKPQDWDLEETFILIKKMFQDASDTKPRKASTVFSGWIIAPKAPEQGEVDEIRYQEQM